MPFAGRRDIFRSLATPTRTSFRLTGADGGPLRGDVRTGGRGARPAVVLCHGFKGFKDWGFFPHLADRLARAGLTAVSFNFSGSGVGEDGETFDELERFGHMSYSKHLRDLEIVCEALLGGAWGAAPSSLGLLGHSMGGAICLLRAAQDSGVRALVTWGAMARFGSLWRPEQVDEWRESGAFEVLNTRTGQALPLYTDILDDLELHAGTTLDLLAAAGRVRAPWLIVHGDADESVPAQAAQDLKRATGDGVAELLSVRGGSHTFSVRHPWQGPTRAYEIALGASVDWLVRHLA